MPMARIKQYRVERQQVGNNVMILYAYMIAGIFFFVAQPAFSCCAYLDNFPSQIVDEDMRRREALSRKRNLKKTIEEAKNSHKGAA